MTTATPTQIADTYFAALAAGDLATVSGLLADEVAWHQPGDNRFSGAHIGGPAVGALISGMMEVTGGTFVVEKTGPAMGNGAKVAVPVRFSASREGLTMDMAGVDLLTIEDGRIAVVELFSADGEAEDRFWGHA
ncbi:nuclear transport factor 2 family protein [Mariniluteicoccus endophyticus]